LKALITILSFLFCVSGMAQNQLDTLWHQWQDTSLSDSKRVSRLHKYTWKKFIYSNQDSALKLIEIEYNFAKKHGLRKSMAGALNSKGVTYKAHGNFEKAMESYKECLKIYEELDHKRGISVSLNNIGAIYIQLEDHASTIEYYNRSLAIKEETGDRKGMGTSLTNIAVVYMSQGDYNRAEATYRKSLAIAKEVKSNSNISLVYSGLGLVYKYKMEFDSALVYFNKSLTILTDENDRRGIARRYTNIGNVYKNMGYLDSAMMYHQKSLAIKKEVNDITGYSLSLNNIGNIHRRKNEYEKAVKLYKESLILAQESHDAIAIKLASNGLLLSYCALDSVELALEHMQRSHGIRIQMIEHNFQILSEAGKEMYFETMKSDFDHYYDFAFFAKDKIPTITGQAYNDVLLTKGLLLKSSTAMRNAVLNSGDTVLIQQFNRWMELNKKINKNYSKGKSSTALEDEANELEKALVISSQEFSDIKQIRNLTWEQVQSNLERGEAAIEFIRFNHQQDYRIEDSLKAPVYCALLLKPEYSHPKMIRLCSEVELEQILGDFPGNNLTYIESLYGKKEELNTELYDLIWKPLEQELQKVKKVYFSPDGLLHKVSFWALADNNGNYLSNQKEMEMYSSTGRLATKKVANNASTDYYISLFGGIDYNTENSNELVWSYLEGTKKEVEDIQMMLSDSKEVACYTGENATEVSFKNAATNSRMLHIATHGFFFPDPNSITKKEEVQMGDMNFRGTRLSGQESFVKTKNPLMRSGLAFSGANEVWNADHPEIENDGVVTAQEVIMMDLRNVDLVVLSACETGLGDIKGSEGVYGLQRSFKMAGVHSLIMSLWQVPDKETTEFMTLFYKRYLKHSDLKKAFKETQQTMRKRYGPYYWGAFVLVD